jgi:hypothetical protein
MFFTTDVACRPYCDCERVEERPSPRYCASVAAVMKYVEAIKEGNIAITAPI